VGRVCAALDGGDPGLLGFFAGALLRVVDPEGAEGLEVVIFLLAAALGLNLGGGSLLLVAGGGRRVFRYLFVGRLWVVRAAFRA
jgi:hypothetical protein